METKKIAGLFVIAVVVAFAVLAAGCAQKASNSSQGRAVFTVADAAADMGTVTRVLVTVDSLQVQNASGGWITVSSTPHAYDLLQLKALRRRVAESGMVITVVPTNSCYLRSLPRKSV